MSLFSPRFLKTGGLAAAVLVDALAREQVMGRIRPGGDARDTVLTERERDRVLDEQTRQFGAEAEGSAAGSGGGSVLRRLIEQEKVSDEALRLLAQRRAARIKDHLVLRGGIADARLFLQDVTLNAPFDGTHVRLEMALDAP